MKTPDVSVVIPVYNGVRFLSQTIESVLQQTHKNFECILVNDGSTDASSHIIATFLEKDPRIRYIEQKNQGGAAARNTGIEHAQAPFVAMLDQDDICLPQRLEKQLQYLASHPAVTLVGSFIQIIDAHGKLTQQDYPLPHGAETVTEKLGASCVLVNPSIMFRRNVVLDIGGYRPQFSLVDDYDLFLRIKEAGYLLDSIPEVLLHYRLHGENHSVVKALDMAWERATIKGGHKIRCAYGLDPTKNGIRPFSIEQYLPYFMEHNAEDVYRGELLQAHLESYYAFDKAAGEHSIALLQAYMATKMQAQWRVPWSVLLRLPLRSLRGKQVTQAAFMGLAFSRLIAYHLQQRILKFWK